MISRHASPTYYGVSFIFPSAFILWYASADWHCQPQDTSNVVLLHLHTNPTALPLQWTLGLTYILLQGIDFIRIGRYEVVHEEVRENCLSSWSLVTLSKSLLPDWPTEY